MRAKNLRLLFATGVLVLAACTGDGAGYAGDPKVAEVDPLENDLLVVGTDRGPVALSPATGSVLAERAGALASPDGLRLYDATSAGGSTLLETVDLATGVVSASTRIRGDLDVRVVSGSGRLAALMDPLADGADTWTPIPRARTTIVVTDPTGVDGARRYRLTGNFEPEAFSTDDSTLFLIQHLPAESPVVYRVTVLDLATGEVGAVAGRFKTPPERMPGTRLAQTLGPDGTQLYTLYTSQPPAYVEEIRGATGRPVAFVHVLSLSEGWAYCVGLPEIYWGRPASEQAMAISPAGERLYVVEAARGLVTEIDTSSLEVLRTVRFGSGSQGGPATSAEVGTDGRTLFVGSGHAVLGIDLALLELVHSWPTGTSVSGLRLSVDGSRLYVALGDRVAALDAETGSEIAAVPFAGADGIVDVGSRGT